MPDTPPARVVPRNASLKALPTKEFDYWKAHHLLNRAGFGGTPDQVRALANMGLDDAVDYIIDYRDLEYEVVNADDFDSDIMRPRTDSERREIRQARQSGNEARLERARQERQARQRQDRRQIREIQKWWMKRLIESPRPLEEKMTLFWHGHFATGYRTIEDSYHMFLQNQLFRANATGNFKKLTHQIIRDPAMLRYLNNNQNRRQQPNENLARELMELFTMGEGHGYSEADIKQGARALTGYTYDDDRFVFRQRLHDPGDKRIFGKTGAWDGDEFVDLIFGRNYASEFLCLKLYRFFVNDLPAGPDKAAQGFVKRLAKRFRDKDYELKPVLRVIFKSAHFYHDDNVAAVIKSPMQLMVQAIRSLRTPVRSLAKLIEAGDLMGQNLCQPPSVKGWDGGRSWINTSTMFVRQNIMVYLLTGQEPGAAAWEADDARADLTHLVEHLAPPGEPIDSGDAARYLLRFMLGTPPHPDRVDTIRRYLEGSGGRPDRELLTEVVSLIAAMPEYQLS
jgi:uncharacterized protein (DUF1800 family)